MWIYSLWAEDRGLESPPWLGRLDLIHPSYTGCSLWGIQRYHIGSVGEGTYQWQQRPLPWVRTVSYQIIKTLWQTSTTTSVIYKNESIHRKLMLLERKNNDPSYCSIADQHISICSLKEYYWSPFTDAETVHSFQLDYSIFFKHLA